MLSKSIYLIGRQQFMVSAKKWRRYASLSMLSGSIFLTLTGGSCGWVVRDMPPLLRSSCTAVRPPERLLTAVDCQRRPSVHFRLATSISVFLSNTSLLFQDHWQFLPFRMKGITKALQRYVDVSSKVSSGMRYVRSWHADVLLCIIGHLITSPAGLDWLRVSLTFWHIIIGLQNWCWPLSNHPRVHRSRIQRLVGCFLISRVAMASYNWPRTVSQWA